MMVQDVSRINEEQSSDEMCLDSDREEHQRQVERNQVLSISEMMKQAKNPKPDPYLVKAAAVLGDVD